MVKMLAVCFWQIYSAIYIMDHSGLVLREKEAKEP